MKPISHERVVWLRERNRVLNGVVHIAQSDLRHAPHRLDLRQALMNAEAERTGNAIEIVVLENQFEVKE